MTHRAALIANPRVLAKLLRAAGVEPTERLQFLHADPVAPLGQVGVEMRSQYVRHLQPRGTGHGRQLRTDQRGGGVLGDALFGADAAGG